MIYSPAYSPDLIPIEYAFRSYKAGLRRWAHARPGRPVDVGAAHVMALSGVTREKVCNIYRHVGYIDNVPPPKLSSKEEADAFLLLVAAVVVVLN